MDLCIIKLEDSSCQLSDSKYICQTHKKYIGVELGSIWLLKQPIILPLEEDAPLIFTLSDDGIILIFWLDSRHVPIGGCGQVAGV